MAYLVIVGDVEDILVEVTGADNEMEARRAAFKVVYGDASQPDKLHHLYSPSIPDDRSVKDLTEVISIAHRVDLSGE
jgi:hypothetical protein